MPSPDHGAAPAPGLWLGWLCVEWRCLDCGDGGIKKLAGHKFPTLNDEAWERLRAIHNEQNPGCDAWPDSARARVLTPDEMDGRLRAG